MYLRLDKDFYKGGDILKVGEETVKVKYMIGWRWYHRLLNWVSFGYWCKKPTQFNYKFDFV